MTETFYAHTKDGELPDRWQPLDDHLKRVVELARSFAAELIVIVQYSIKMR